MDSKTTYIPVQVSIYENILKMNIWILKCLSSHNEGVDSFSGRDCHHWKSAPSLSLVFSLRTATLQPDPSGERSSRYFGLRVNFTLSPYHTHMIPHCPSFSFSLALTLLGLLFECLSMFPLPSFFWVNLVFFLLLFLVQFQFSLVYGLCLFMWFSGIIRFPRFFFFIVLVSFEVLH